MLKFKKLFYEFKKRNRKTSKLLSAVPGISRRQAVLETLIIKPNDHIIDIGVAGSFNSSS